MQLSHCRLGPARPGLLFGGALRASRAVAPAPLPGFCELASRARLAAALETVLVAPLDSALDLYQSFPGAVRVDGDEAGTRSDQVVIVTLLSAIASARFERDAVGRLRPESLSRVERVARLALELP